MNTAPSRHKKNHHKKKLFPRNPGSATAYPNGMQVYEQTGHKVFIHYKIQAPGKPADQVQVSRRMEMNIVQSNMFRRLMYGLGGYSKMEISSMSANCRRTIKRDHAQAAELIRRMKYDRVYGKIDQIFNSLLAPDQALTYTGADTEHSDRRNGWIACTGLRNESAVSCTPFSYEQDGRHTSLPTLRQLGIQTHDIVDLFISRGLLPQEFRRITPGSVARNLR